MNSTTSKLFIAAAFLAAALTSGCASFSIEGDDVSATTEQGQEINVAMKQLEESGRGGGD